MKRFGILLGLVLTSLTGTVTPANAETPTRVCYAEYDSYYTSYAVRVFDGIETRTIRHYYITENLDEAIAKQFAESAVSQLAAYQYCVAISR